MIRRFCDQCHEEITNQFFVGQPHFEKGRIRVRFMRAVDGTWNAGDVCIACIRDVAAKGELVTDNGRPVNGEGA